MFNYNCVELDAAFNSLLLFIVCRLTPIEEEVINMI
jgi:hypothetical protein